MKEMKYKNVHNEISFLLRPNNFSKCYLGGMHRLMYIMCKWFVYIFVLNYQFSQNIFFRYLSKCFLRFNLISFISLYMGGISISACFSGLMTGT